MPEPVTIIAAVAAVAGLASAGVGAYQSMSNASAQSDAAKYNAQVAENNAKQAQMEADAEAQKIRSRNRRIIASQKAQFAASGVQITGTVTDVMVDSATQGELDAMSAEYAGEVRSKALQSQAELDRKAASNASKAGIFGTAGYGLQGVSIAASSYSDYRYKKDMLALKNRKP